MCHPDGRSADDSSAGSPRPYHLAVVTSHRAAPETADDGHFVVIDGRRWRATDPEIPTAFRAELVRELMAARRAVGQLSRAGEDTSVARERVGDAKVALGERGEPWWDPPTAAGQQRRIEATTRALLRARRASSSICPSDVARAVGGRSWRSMVPIVREVASELVGNGTIIVTQGDQPVDLTTARGPVRLRGGPALQRDIDDG